VWRPFRSLVRGCRSAGAARTGGFAYERCWRRSLRSLIAGCGSRWAHRQWPRRLGRQVGGLGLWSMAASFSGGRRRHRGLTTASSCRPRPCPTSFRYVPPAGKSARRALTGEFNAFAKPGIGMQGRTRRAPPDDPESLARYRQYKLLLDGQTIRSRRARIVGGIENSGFAAVAAFRRCLSPTNR
jgi:hypothetical protein